MIQKTLRLKMGYVNSILSEPLHLYIYDKNIKIRLQLIEYDFRFGGDLNGNFIGKNPISEVKAHVKSPKGETFSNEKTRVDSNGYATIIIGEDMLNEINEIGEWEVQLQLFDSDGSSMHVHPFKFFVHDLITRTGDIEFDAGNTSGSFVPDDVINNDVITAELLNGYEYATSEIYNRSLITDTEISTYKTENKVTTGAINELVDQYRKLSETFNSYLEGTLDIEAYIKENNIPVNTSKEYISSVVIRNKEQNTLNIGDSLIYNFEVSPYRRNKHACVQWISSNPLVAEVFDNGKVIGKARGSAFIMVYSKLNGNICDMIKLTVI